MIQISFRQILIIALLSGVVAAGAVIGINRYSHSIQPTTKAETEAANTGQPIANPSNMTDEQNNIEVYRTMSPGVAFITSIENVQDFWGDTNEREGAGSGSIIDEQGRILTNNHVVEGADKLTVSLGDGKQYPARVVGTDPDTDLAVIQLTELPKNKLTIIPFGDSDKLSVGQKVLAIGNPFGLDRTLTTGIISGLQRPIRARTNRPIEGAIQTDASINPGNSGGPLLDSTGRMIGINSQILSPSGASVGVGFAIPASIAKRVVPQLIANGKVSRPKLGIGTRDISTLKNYLDLKIDSGVLVMQVYPGGSAATAGIRGTQQTADGGVVLGDIITAIDGGVVKESDDLFRILDRHQVGDVVKVDVFRDGAKQTINVRLLDYTPETQQQQPRRRRM